MRPTCSSHSISREVNHDDESPLERAKRHVLENRSRIEDQKARLSEFEHDRSKAAEVARQLLKALEAFQEQAEDRLRRLKEEAGE